MRTMSMGILSDDLVAGARFVRDLPRFLRRPIGPAEARVTVSRRLDCREADLLRLVRSTIYEHAGSPYRELLRVAGCEYRDVERLVGREGVEGALLSLYRSGVYLTVDEYKGRRAAMRGGDRIEVDPVRLRNPLASPHAPARSGGSRGAGAPVPMNLGFVADRAANLCVVLAAREGLAWQHANWRVPGGAAMVQLLEYAKCAARPVRWFSQLSLAEPGLHPRYLWSARAMRAASLLAGRPLPVPRHVSLENPQPIAQWMAGVLRTGGTPHLSTFVSSATRLCEAASRAGIDLEGARFTVSGEPITPARVAVIERAGARALPQYGNSESGTLGYACLRPRAPDEVHAHRDLHALIQPDAANDRVSPPPRPLFITSLRLSTPLVMLNVSLGDQAVLEERACGCPLEEVGWTTHLHGVRSFEKLTAGGMTFLDTDVIRVLEEVLPARFGGAPTDYQLLEEEGDDGELRLRMLVSPTVGSLDLAAVADAFLEAIGSRSGTERVMELHWRKARLLEVERRAPLTTPTGKILHLHRGPDRTG